jgi:hypothetical protein
VTTPVPLGNSIVTSGDVVILVYGIAEDGMSPGPSGVEIGDPPNRQRCGFGWPLLTGLVRPVLVVVRGVSVEYDEQMPVGFQN